MADSAWPTLNTDKYSTEVLTVYDVTALEKAKKYVYKYMKIWNCAERHFPIFNLFFSDFHHTTENSIPNSLH